MPGIAEPVPETTGATTTRLDRQYRMTVDRYCLMVEAGVFGDKSPIFLWKGRLVTKMAKNPPHHFAMASLLAILTRLVPEGWYVAFEQPVALGDDSMPEPDISIVRGTPRDYLKRRRRAADVPLVIEIADSSLSEDRGEVLQANAAESIPVYWIVNLLENQVEAYTDPTGPGNAPTYRTRRVFRHGDSMPVVLDGREIGQVAVDDFLP